MENCLDIYSTSKEKLTEIVEKYTADVFGIGFKFRPHQKESIVDTIYAWYNDDTSDVIIDAPTGSGKSIIAMIIAGVLSTYFGKTGYILISDLSLLQQYANDLEIYFPDWGLIRGQQTYTCQVNGFNFQSGTCKLAGCKTYSDIREKYAECSKYCEYLLARQKAICANVTVFTYTNWLIQQNFVRPKLKDSAPFQKRDFVICDECHKLLEIVQNHFSPKFGKDDESKINNVIDHMHISKPEQLKNEVHGKREEIRHAQDNIEIEKLLYEYTKIISKINEKCDSIKESIGSKKTELTRADRTTIYACDFVKDHFCKFDDYTAILHKFDEYDSTGTYGANCIIKNESEIGGTITFNCIEETYLMNKAFHNNCEKKMYMSATVGDPTAYANEINISNYKHIKLPPVFDYTNSPIYFVNEYKMSYREKDTSFPKIVEMIIGVMKMYQDKRGIIQTGSYAFAKKMYDMLPPELKKRILLYDDSRDKQEKLDDFKYSTNKVLVGPTLIEGLSLNDDLCRFQIIMKIPYPSLADKYVSTKSKVKPQWYTNTTSISLLQGVGRGIRNENDWCVTFILDACFYGLFYQCRNMFGPEFSNRIQIINSTNLLI